MANDRIAAITARLRLRIDRAGTPPDPRFSLANERTFLAWNRTALALIGGGLAAAQLLRFELGGARLMVGLPLIALGAAVGLAGITRWRACEVAMRRRARLPRPRFAVALLGIGASAIAVLSIVLLVLSQLQS